jgi:hypothetical protein
VTIKPIVYKEFTVMTDRNKCIPIMDVDESDGEASVFTVRLKSQDGGNRKSWYDGAIPFLKRQRNDDNFFEGGHMTEAKKDAPIDDASVPTITFTMKLKVVDAESNTSRYVTPEEAEAMDWKDPTMMRMVAGWQISSYERLVFLLHEKAKKGDTEVEMIEAPRFMMLSGG